MKLYQVSPEKNTPIIHLLYIVKKKPIQHSHILTYKREDHGRGVPRDHSDTVMSDITRIVQSKFLGVSIPRLVRGYRGGDGVKHLTIHAHELIGLRTSGGGGRGVGIVPLRHVGVAMVTIHAISGWWRQAVVVLLAGGLCTSAQRLQLHGRIGFFVIRIFTVTGAAGVGWTMHVGRMRRIAAWRRAMVGQIVWGGDVIVLCHVVVWQTHGTGGPVRAGPG